MEHLISLKEQPSIEQQSRELKSELGQKNFARADMIKEITVSRVFLSFLCLSTSSFIFCRNI